MEEAGLLSVKRKPNNKKMQNKISELIFPINIDGFYLKAMRWSNCFLHTVVKVDVSRWENKSKNEVWKEE